LCLPWRPVSWALYRRLGSNFGLARGGFLPLEWGKIVLLSRLTALGRKSVPETAVSGRC